MLFKLFWDAFELISSSFRLGTLDLAYRTLCCDRFGVLGIWDLRPATIKNFVFEKFCPRLSSRVAEFRLHGTGTGVRACGDLLR